MRRTMRLRASMCRAHKKAGRRLCRPAFLDQVSIV
jgi:hypothetical protein